MTSALELDRQWFFTKKKTDSAGVWCGNLLSSLISGSNYKKINSVYDFCINSSVTLGKSLEMEVSSL
jgi:hypothetical protein